MSFSFKKLSSDVLFRVLFHVIFWFYWIVLPILNAQLEQDDRRLKFLMEILPATLACFPFFYLNSNFLIPKFLPKGRIPSYIFSLCVLFIVFLVSQYFIKKSLTDRPITIYDTRTMFPVLFILSMSTVYGFIVFLVSQQRQRKEEEEVRLKSELSFLRSQISPHFIFNVLNSIVYLIKKEPKSAEKVTMELADLLRYMLYESELKQVELDKEIAYLENYIKLQNIRFGDDVKLILNIDKEYKKGLLIEPMLLIPFVENAFKHGVGLIKNPEILVDLIVKDSKVLNFSVTNQVSEKNISSKEIIESGIGLKNVKRRVELLYTDNHNLEILEKDHKFSVKLQLQLKEM